MQRQIQRLLASLKSYQPKKVILFGSSVRGVFREGSDLDILVIKDTDEPFWERQKKVATLIRTDLEVDAFVLTPEEVEKALQEVQPFIYDVINTGKVIYEQT